MPRKLSKPEQRERQLDRQIEKRISFIRKNPRLDKYGRPIPDGSPIGMGDKNWIKNYGIGGYSSVKTPILGVGIPRDSYLPRECRENEKNALRVLRSADEHTPRSTKLTKEIKKWAKKNYLHENNAFMAQLIQVSKRVKPISSLQRPPYNISLENLSELHPLIYKFANYSLQDKRQINAHFGGSTREQNFPTSEFIEGRQRGDRSSISQINQNFSNQSQFLTRVSVVHVQLVFAHHLRLLYIASASVAVQH